MQPITTEAGLLDYLDAQSIAYTRAAHQPVYTCADADIIHLGLAGVQTKNLFIKDGAGSYYLVMTACEKRLDLKALGASVGRGRLQLGSPEALLECLGLTPGAVTVLALVNDPARRVELLVDSAYWPADAYLCHPLVNTATLSLEHAALVKFLDVVSHPARVVEMAER